MGRTFLSDQSPAARRGFFLVPAKPSSVHDAVIPKSRASLGMRHPEPRRTSAEGGILRGSYRGCAAARQIPRPAGKSAELRDDVLKTADS